MVGQEKAVRFQLCLLCISVRYSCLISPLSLLHFAHVADRVGESKLGNVWLNALAEPITLEEIIRDYGRHLGLHLGEIEDLVEFKQL